MHTICGDILLSVFIYQNLNPIPLLYWSRKSFVFLAQPLPQVSLLFQSRHCSIIAELACSQTKSTQGAG